MSATLLAFVLGKALDSVRGVWDFSSGETLRGQLAGIHPTPRAEKGPRSFRKKVPFKLVVFSFVQGYSGRRSFQGTFLNQGFIALAPKTSPWSKSCTGPALLRFEP